MPLDVFLTNSQNEIDEETLHFSINEREFNTLISLAKPIKSFPIVNKLSDYYSDCVLNNSEIETLISELSNLSTSDNFIDSFIKFLKKSDGCRAFFFSD